MRYIDLNMVRACAIRHPREWNWTGWAELMGERKRNCLVNLDLVVELLAEKDVPSFRKRYAQSVEEVLQRGPLVRKPSWSEAVAVGSAPFIAEMEPELLRAYTRKRLEKSTMENGSMVLRECESSYGSKKEPEN